MTKTLKILNWNANGLQNHIPELEIFLNTERIDICLISESHLTRTSYALIKGFKCYHAIHPSGKARGGATIYVRNNIKHYEYTKIEFEYAQIITIKVQLNSYKTLSVAAIYCPPKYNLKKDDYITMLQTLGISFIIGGDFNAKNTFWGSRLTSPKGRELLEAGHQLKCEFLTGKTPTYWPSDPNKKPDLIDFFISKGISENYIHIENHDGLSSDHSPVILTVSESVIEKDIPHHLTNKKTNWKLFSRIVEENTNLKVPIKNTIQLEEEMESLINNIQSAAWASTPIIKSNPIKFNTYTDEIRDLLRKKRIARKKWHTIRIPENKTIYNRLKNQLKELIQETKREALNKYLNSLSDHKDNDYSLWKATRHIKRPNVQVPPVKCENNTWARSPKEKTVLFANHLERIFQPLPRQSEEENATRSYREDELPIKSVTLKELKAEIKLNLNNKKTPGYELITGIIIKNLPEICLKKILNLINISFKLRHVPLQWKVAEVIMIQKPNKPPNEVTSYRPISILPILSKLFEKLLLKRLKHLAEERHLIPAHQFGFREKHSTIEQVHRVTNVIEEAFNNRQICSAVFLDVAQAFDRVWHQGLEYKLHRNLPTQYFEILKSYIEDRYFRVKYEGQYSELKKIKSGVPQGSVLGPFLYLIFTNDIPQPDETIIATFADDTAILAVGNTIEESTNKLQRSINKIYNWTSKWRIKLNESKSIHVNFSNKILNNLPIYINEQEIPYSNTAKYLGMTLDTKLKWKEHVKIKRKELDLKFRKMYWLIGRNSELSIGNKTLLYKQILKPVWTYGIQLWGCTNKTNIKMIQTFQNKVLRCIVDAPWYIRNDDLHRDLRIEYVSEEIIKNAEKHILRLQTHENDDIQQLVYNRRTARRLKRTIPLDLASQH